VEAVIQILAYGLMVGSLYALIGMGFSLIFSVMKYVNIAQGTFIMFGGYACFFLFGYLKIDPYLSIPPVMVIMFFMGAALYKLLFSRLSDLPVGIRLNSSMLITFGLIWVLDNVATLMWTSDVRSVTTSYTGREITLAGVRLGFTGIAGMALALIFIMALHLLLTKTYFGKAVRAATDDAEAAALSGINVHRTFLISCGIGIALASLAGVVIATTYSISPSGGLPWLLVAMVVVVLAGEGNVSWVFPAGLLLGLIEAASVFFAGASYREVVSLLLFITVLVFKPEGLFAKGSIVG
jgi:branched-chain amino acid transport system permease protein